MTAPARITQADVERATKSVKAAGFERARIVMDLVNGRIEIILGESGEPPKVSRGGWEEE
ncbi:hypothetical protein GR702_04540 [Novosphingobium sp. FGD1]|jgi:hypothetical protein|uniref:Uncharacterized protein n=1 Tax=Novosphingobium silvae TaxID=2692619 RepID=A0A7X4GEQ3_9SPHN|nr:hypothetical protein [Novosphingobium silvae]MYL97040.1 hypothetical protein [Novosphingobium silvae]